MIEFLPTQHLKALCESVKQQGKPVLQADDTATLHNIIFLLC